MKNSDAIVEREGDAADWSLVAAHYEDAQRFDDAVLAYERAAAQNQVVDYLSAQARRAQHDAVTV